MKKTVKQRQKDRILKPVRSSFPSLLLYHYLPDTPGWQPDSFQQKLKKSCSKVFGSGKETVNTTYKSHKKVVLEITMPRTTNRKVYFVALGTYAFPNIEGKVLGFDLEFDGEALPAGCYEDLLDVFEEFARYFMTNLLYYGASTNLNDNHYMSRDKDMEDEF